MKKIHISHNDMLYVVFTDVTTSEFTGHVAHCYVVSDILWLYLIEEYRQVIRWLPSKQTCWLTKILDKKPGHILGCGT